jgi:hypothetical protein
MSKAKIDIGGVKMKRNILTIIIAVALFGIALTSCKNRDDNDKVMTAEEMEKESKVEARVKAWLAETAQAAKAANDAALATRKAKDVELHAENAVTAVATVNVLIEKAKDLMDSNPKIVKADDVKAIELLAKYVTWQAAIAEENMANASQTLEIKAKVEVEYKRYDGMRSASLEVLDIAKGAYKDAKGNPDDLTAI